MDAVGSHIVSGAPVLGPVAFEGYEVPERIRIGGRQQLAVHNLPGGGRVVDAMGPDEAPIEWSGVFSGPSAAERVRALERLRRSADTLELSWDGWRYSVVIEQFTAEVTSPWWIPYEIRLCVVPEQGLGSDTDPISEPTQLDLGLTTTGQISDEQIATASAGLTAPNLGDAVAASGALARAVSARAFVESKL